MNHIHVTNGRRREMLTFVYFFLNFTFKRRKVYKMKSFSSCQVPHFLPEANTILYWHAFLKVFNITANTCILKQYTAFNF